MKLFSKNPVKRPKRQYSLAKQLWWKLQDKWRSVKHATEGKLVTLRGGYKCIDCGSTTARFKNPHYEGVVNGKRMMIDFTPRNLPFGKTLCPHCLYKKVEQYWGRAPRLETTNGYTPHSSSGVYEGVCQWYGPGLVAQGIRPWDNPLSDTLFGGGYFIIGGQWWNGHDASLRAIKELLTETGSARTGIMSSSSYTLTGNVIKFGEMLYTDGRVYGKPQSVKDIV